MVVSGTIWHVVIAENGARSSLSSFRRVLFHFAQIGGPDLFVAGLRLDFQNLSRIFVRHGCFRDNMARRHRRKRGEIVAFLVPAGTVSLCADRRPGSLRRRPPPRFPEFVADLRASWLFPGQYGTSSSPKTGRDRRFPRSGGYCFTLRR